MESKFEHLNFCNTVNFIEDLINILSTCFDFNSVGENIIRESYNEFSRNFYGIGNDFKTISFKNFSPLTSDKDFNEKCIDLSFTVGVDLPVYIKNKTISNNECVIIIGEDPLRSKESSKENIKHEIILSTPFAMHYSKYRDGKGKLYRDYIIYLLNEGYSVYLTDINKIWVKNLNKDTIKVKIPESLSYNFEKCLEKEIDFCMRNNLKSTIITFGNIAKEHLDRLEISNKGNAINFPHPAAWASKWESELGNKNIKHADKLRFMKDQINKHKF
jgi:hypothetical protein